MSATEDEDPPGQAVEKTVEGPLFKYKRRDRWEERKKKDREKHPEGSQAGDELTLLSMNVWFEFVYRTTRNAELLRLLQETAPTVACFQEAVSDFVHVLHSDPWVRAHYFSTGQPHSRYGCLILLRIDRCLRPSLARTELPSSMGRDLLVARFELRASDGRVVPISLATVHLESLSFRDLRARQLRWYAHAHAHTNGAAEHPSRLSILCGDFNFCSQRNWSADDTRPLENDALLELLPGFVDVWQALHGTHPPLLHPPEDPVLRRAIGYTFDTDLNGNIGDSTPEHMRYDRVMARFDPARWQARSIRLIGDQPCLKNLPERKSVFGKPVKDYAVEVVPTREIWPSDHFGLLTNFHLGDQRD